MSETRKLNIQKYRLKTKEMLLFGFKSYLTNAYPYDELKPISCSGFDTLGNFSLTLIDAVDTLAVIEELDLFQKFANLIKFVSFDINVNVSTFETSIRIVGGLVSSHLIALEKINDYDGFLLDKAVIVADKLLTAFDTDTGIPFGTVNLVYGVPPNETPVTCTACAGTYHLEFAWLSKLTGNQIYEITSLRSMRALYEYKTNIGLFGSHINLTSGYWVYADSSIGG